MLGATTIVLFLFAMTSSLEAGQLRSCVVEDVCSAIIFNQLAIASMKDDMSSLLLTLNNTRNSEQMVPKRDLDSCLIRHKHQKKQIVSLEKKIEEVLPNDEARDQRLEEENHRLEQTIIEKDREIRNLTSLTCKNQGPDDEKDELRREVDDLRRTMENQRRSHEEEHQRLEQVIIQKDEHIKNLTLLNYMPVDCADIQNQGQTESGIYTIYPNQTETDVSIDVLCDLDSNGGGWTVFFTRQPQDEPLDFNASWDKFKNGFGNVNTEYWLGNDFIHVLTSHGTSSLRLDAEIYSGERRWAEWNVFSIEDEESKYKMTLGDYEVTSTMGDSLSQNSNSSFTTYDDDNDARIDLNCAVGTQFSYWGKGGWWYKGCGSARLTAPLKSSCKWHSSCYRNWDPEGKSLVSFKALSMKFRRHNYEEFTVPRK